MSRLLRYRTNQGNLTLLLRKNLTIFPMQSESRTQANRGVGVYTAVVHTATAEVGVKCTIRIALRRRPVPATKPTDCITSCFYF